MKISLVGARCPSDEAFRPSWCHISGIAVLELSADSACACSEILEKRNNDSAEACSGLF